MSGTGRQEKADGIPTERVDDRWKERSADNLAEGCIKVGLLIPNPPCVLEGTPGATVDLGRRSLPGYQMPVG